MTAGAYFLAPYTSPSGPLHAAICLAAALAVAGAGAVADRLWNAAIAPSLGPMRPAAAAMARYPFRLLAGGIAVTVAMLTAKRAGLLWVEDVPVKEIFASGALLALAWHLARESRPRARAADPPAAGVELTERNPR